MAASVAGTAAKAQSLSFAVRAGINGSHIRSSMPGLDTETDTKVGFYVGAAAEQRITKHFAIEPQLYFSEVGAKYQIDFTDETDPGNIIKETFDMKNCLGYLNLPVLLKFKASGWSVFAGPQIGYLLYANVKSDGESLDNREAYKSTEFSGIAGFSYTLRNGFGADVRYQFGLANIAKDPEPQLAQKSNAFSAGIHYFFNRK